MVRQWSRLSRDVVDVPSLDTFKVSRRGFDLAVGVLVHGRGSELDEL